MLLKEVIGYALNVDGPKLGIECETEGRGLPVIANAFWRTEQDGSLRNGLEYVSAPIMPEKVVTAINNLIANQQKHGAVVDFSFRCSTHVHINVQDLNEKQLVNMIFLYALFENVFMNFVAKERVGNRFCLRFQDAGALTYEVAQFFRYALQERLAVGVHELNQNSLKYAAINLYTLRKYGTLEFRALEGCNDPQRIKKWIDAIVALRELAMNYDTPRALYEDFLERPHNMAMRLFGHARADFLKDGWKQQVEEAVSQNQILLASI